MKIKYNNLYTHFIFTTQARQGVILEKNRIRIEKYITGIVNNVIKHTQYMQIPNIFIFLFPALLQYHKKN